MTKSLAARAAVALEPLIPRFQGQTALIFAPGPSLTELWSPIRPIPFPSIAVNDAWRIAPQADVCYATDSFWWQFHRGVPEFGGVKVGYQGPGPAGIVWLQGSGGEGYDPRLGWVRHGQSSGHAAAHLAAQLKAAEIILIGFDCRPVDGKEHFFGSHPKEVRRNMPYKVWIERFDILAAELAARGVNLLNATPGSALKVAQCRIEAYI